MVTKDNIKQHTTLIVLIAILTYSILILISDYLFEYQLPVLREVSKFSIKGIYFPISIITSVFVSILLMKWKPIVKLFLGEQYIAGKYIGSSRPPISEEVESHKETIVIKQTLIGTSISGVSDTSQNNFTTWEGTLFKVENSSFLFAISLTTEPFEYGILSLQFFENTFHGMYYSTNPVNYKTYIMRGEKSE
jgi:hypothetical protein